MNHPRFPYFRNSDTNRPHYNANDDYFDRILDEMLAPVERRQPSRNVPYPYAPTDPYPPDEAFDYEMPPQPRVNFNENIRNQQPSTRSRLRIQGPDPNMEFLRTGTIAVENDYSRRQRYEDDFWDDIDEINEIPPSLRHSTHFPPGRNHDEDFFYQTGEYSPREYSPFSPRPQIFQPRPGRQIPVHPPRRRDPLRAGQRASNSTQKPIPPLKPEKPIVFPKRKITDEEFKESKECPICLQPFEKGVSYANLKCGHMFHEKCVRTWTNEHKNCPYCRADL